MVFGALLACLTLGAALGWRERRQHRLWRARAERAELAAARAAALLEALPAAVVGIDPDGTVRYLNPRAEAMTGFAAAAGCGQSVLELLTVHQDGAVLDPCQQVADCLGRGAVIESGRNAVLMRRLDGKRIDIQHSCAPLGPGAPGAVMLLQDVSARRSVEARLEFIAHHDGLTGLPNRLQFQIQLAHGIAYAKRHHTLLAVLFVDIDHFKSINDTLGHEAGDQVLLQFGQRLLQSVRKVDTVARQGGDEFIVLLTEVRTPEDVQLVADKIGASLAAPFAIGAAGLAVSASVGMAIYPDDDNDVGALIDKADLAMYAAKRRGPGPGLRYAASMQARSYSRMILETALGSALEQEQFILAYQPQLLLREQRIGAVKALLRWKHPDLGLVLPLDFWPVLEESSLMPAVGDWVLAGALRQARCWLDAGAPLVVSVCLSARQLHQPDMAARVGAALAQAGVAGRWLELEISEAHLIDKHQRCEQIVARFKQLGVHIAIGQVGSGNATLQYLRRYGVDVAKIDKRYVDPLRRPESSGEDDSAMARAIIAGAHSLNVRVVASGVETEEQLARLTALGCDEVFGFCLSRAVAPAEIDALIKCRHHRGELAVQA